MARLVGILVKRDATSNETSTYLTLLCSAAFHLIYMILFCIRAKVVYSYGACIFTVIYLPACLHLLIMICSGLLVNVELKKLQAERAKHFHGLINPKILPPSLYQRACILVLRVICT